MVKRSTQNRELVRFTPFQFSISAGVVVLLLAGAGMAGYYHGLRKAADRYEEASQATPDVPSASDPTPAQSDTPTPVTFYTVLTEQRDQVPAPVPAQPRKPAEDQGREESVNPQPEGDRLLILQVASYRGHEAAVKLLESLTAGGYSGTIQVADLGERGTWYRVRIGPYGSEIEANGVLEKLRKERDLKGYIVK